MLSPGQIIFSNLEPQDQDASQEMDKLDESIEKSQKVLFKTKTQKIFNFTSNEVIIDIAKVDIVFRDFLGSRQVHSVLLKDLEDVMVETAFLTATLKIVDKGYVENEIAIRYLPKKDGLKARRIIQGLMVARDKGVDLSKINDDQLVDKLEELGKASRPD